MDNDLVLVLGVLIGGFSIPMILSAYAESRPPRAGTVLFVIGAGLIVAAIVLHPTGYQFSDLPDAFVRVIARVIN